MANIVFRAEAALVRAVFQHGARDGHAVKGGRAAAYLVRMSREAGVACFNIFAISFISTMKVDWPEARSSDAPMRVNTLSTMPMVALFAGTKGAYLRHEHDERRLAHVGGLTGHVRPRDNGHAVVGVVEAGVVRNKEDVLHALLNDGVPPLDNGKLARGVDLRHCVIVAHGRLRKGAQHVQPRHGVRGRLYAPDHRRDGVAQLNKAVVFQLVYPVARSEKGVFQLLELLREVALVGDEGLLADIVGGDVRVARGFGHVYIIAEHLVIPDLELLDAGALTLALLKLGDHLRPLSRTLRSLSSSSE